MLVVLDTRDLLMLVKAFPLAILMLGVLGALFLLLRIILSFRFTH